MCYTNFRLYTYMYILLNSIILFILHNKETIIYKIKVDSTLCLYLQKQCTFIQLFREKKIRKNIYLKINIRQNHRVLVLPLLFHAYLMPHITSKSF